MCILALILSPCNFPLVFMLQGIFVLIDIDFAFCNGFKI
ncbi:hypothetical protein L292_1175 [Acinetobacter junii CIP 107470 = MTCC 11364]|uniref:Uncharacterized protein n=1 Tax=Acinetobacter junii CIP 107470 = MTCC 11364 TaxID=1217666 RepID=S7XZQ4_ACIJU|nr:hypothetical protein L292_1175 [Acinetobacter junii CIP 107470 = MTCC 11364]